MEFGIAFGVHLFSCLFVEATLEIRVYSDLYVLGMVEISESEPHQYDYWVCLFSWFICSSKVCDKGWF